jgi:hypothetical protein
MCYRDLASRYGEGDELVREFKSSIPADFTESRQPISSKLFQARSTKPMRFNQLSLPDS